MAVQMQLNTAAAQEEKNAPTICNADAPII
jgi:hypothetical protein